MGTKALLLDFLLICYCSLLSSMVLGFRSISSCEVNLSGTENDEAISLIQVLGNLVALLCRERNKLPSKQG
jgi:hypothetical protein